MLPRGRKGNFELLGLHGESRGDVINEGIFRVDPPQDPIGYTLETGCTSQQRCDQFSGKTACQRGKFYEY